MPSSNGRRTAANRKAAERGNRSEDSALAQNLTKALPIPASNVGRASLWRRVGSGYSGSPNQRLSEAFVLYGNSNHPDAADRDDVWTLAPLPLSWSHYFAAFLAGL